MKAEIKIESLDNYLIEKALRLYKMMKLNEEAYQKAKTKREKSEFEEGTLMFRARWATVMDIIEHEGLEERYYEAYGKELENGISY